MVALALLPSALSMTGVSYGALYSSFSEYRLKNAGQGPRAMKVFTSKAPPLLTSVHPPPETWATSRNTVGKMFFLCFQDCAVNGFGRMYQDGGPRLWF